MLSFDFAESQNQVLAGQDSTAFSVTYHLSQEDADKNNNSSTKNKDEDKVDDYQLTRAFDLILAINLINK